MTRTWPEDWEARKRGDNCPCCAKGRIESDEFGSRFYAGRVADAYLQRSAPACGYSIVIFRGRHVAEPTDFTQAELTAFWLDVQAAAKILESAFEPSQLNYQLLGNAVPHVHVHIVPRYLDDADPERPLSWESSPVAEDIFAEQLRSLEAASASAPVVFPVTHSGLCADMFVVRDGKFLVLTRSGSVGGGVEYIPGGLVERGEDPRDAAIRETKEETGLDVRDVSLLRVWAYAVPQGWDTVHATYVGFADEEDVALTAEHTGFRWIGADDYVKGWCSEQHELSFPDFASWFREVRANCELVRAHLVLTDAGRAFLESLGLEELE